MGGVLKSVFIQLESTEHLLALSTVRCAVQGASTFWMLKRLIVFSQMKNMSTTVTTVFNGFYKKYLSFKLIHGDRK